MIAIRYYRRQRFKPRPRPPLGNPKRHFLRDTRLAQHAALGVDVLLIGGAIRTDVDDALATLGELGLSFGYELVLLFANSVEQDACGLVCGVLRHKLALDSHLED